MPGKYPHMKKRLSKPSRKSNPGNAYGRTTNENKLPDPYADRKISHALSPVTQLERTIAQILLLRFEQDIARLFSTHLYCVALLHLPTFVMRCTNVSGPGWIAANANNDDIKDFFRAAIAMDLRQAGERVATKSVLWSYTALRDFATSNDIPICRKRGLHSVHLLPHYPGLRAHLDALQAMPPASFAKPPHLGPLTEGYRALEESCGAKYKHVPAGSSEADSEWNLKIREGYDRISQILWHVAREFDVRGYGATLRDKLISKWCDCGCSTDHLSEVCEKTIREGEKEHHVRSGKEREWDGRGSGIYGWETEEEEDIWEFSLDQVCLEAEEYEHSSLDPEMTIGELMEWRYLRAELEKEQGNIAFKEGKYEKAIERYKLAHQIEPEMPHYQLNLAAAYLKIDECIKAENACDAALAQHRSVKGYWRRAHARKGQGRIPEAIRDLRAVLQLQPSNTEAAAELERLSPPKRSSKPAATPSSSSMPSSAAGSASRRSDAAKSNRPKSAPTGQDKLLSFARTYRDDFKLKTSFLPLHIDVPVDLPPPFIGSDEKTKRPTPPPPASVPTRLETFSYPNWERYVVQKVA